MKRDGQAAERGYWPTLIDRGDGVAGHFCIGRLCKPGQPYWEFWNKGQWVSAGEVFIGREAAQKQLDAMRVGDKMFPAAPEPSPDARDLTI